MESPMSEIFNFSSVVELLMGDEENAKELLKNYLLQTEEQMGLLKELLLNEDFDNIHIRRIADKAGFHNSTLYSYFKDAEIIENYGRSGNSIRKEIAERWLKE